MEETLKTIGRNKLMGPSSRVEALTVQKKDRLIKEIKLLKSIISGAEWQLATTKYKHIKNIPNEKVLKTTSTKVQDFNADLQSELHKYSGFHCVKYRNGEFVFQFSSSSECTKNNTYMIQIFNVSNKGVLGKWVMPMSVDMQRILRETPINHMENIKYFLRNCKRHIDCYCSRLEQFDALKGLLNDVTNCIVQTSIGYTQISLQFFGIHCLEEDEYININVSLVYDSANARPRKVDVDWDKENMLKEHILKRLKSWLKPFKTLNLPSAFGQLVSQDEVSFAWEWIYVEDSLDRLNSSDSHDEGYLTEIILSHKKSLRRKRRKRERKQLEMKKKSKKGVSNQILKGEIHRQISNVDRVNKDISNNEKYHRIDSSMPSLRKGLENITSEQATPATTREVKMRQTKLNFPNKETIDSGTSNAEIKMPSASRTLRANPIRKLVTSTPLHTNKKWSDAFTATTSFEISDITINGNAADVTQKGSSVRKHRSTKTSHKKNVSKGPKTSKLKDMKKAVPNK